MNPEAQVLLDRITQKGIGELTSNDIMFLQARRSYLTKAQTKKYASVLKSHVKPAKVQKAYGEMTGTQIVMKARRLGIKTKGLTREELERAIDTILGADNALQPE